jgi:hypothetical protein
MAKATQCSAVWPFCHFFVDRLSLSAQVHQFNGPGPHRKDYASFRRFANILGRTQRDGQFRSFVPPEIVPDAFPGQHAAAARQDDPFRMKLLAS